MTSKNCMKRFTAVAVMALGANVVVAMAPQSFEHAALETCAAAGVDIAAESIVDGPNGSPR